MIDIIRHILAIRLIGWGIKLLPNGTHGWEILAAGLITVCGGDWEREFTKAGWREKA